MKKPTILKIALFALILLQSIISHSQNFKSFDVRYNNESLNGDILLIGNNILNRDTRDRWGGGDGPNVPYIEKDGNHNFSMKYIDIDEDPDTFNSSSASLTLPNAACSKVVYAGLYWSAVTRDKSSLPNPNPIDKVKFKMPNGSYVDIKGIVIHDAKNSVVGSSYPYACYANVTEYFTKTPRPNPEGVYTVANVSTEQGSNSNSSGNTGLSAGWSLFIVYENATLPAKAITSFDGFSAIDAKTNLDIEVSGFKAINDGPVRAKFAFSALEGDLPIQGDFLAINGVKSVPPERPTEVTSKRVWNPSKWRWEWVNEENYNFFNSSVTSLGTILNNRIPNSSNTLGFDAGVFEVNNPITTAYPGGSVIKNGDTSATISLGSTGDVYFYYFNAFAIEIIAPRIVLVKKVIGIDENGKDYDASNKDIGIDKELKYEIGFQNKGNDNAVNFTITDILPNNIIFDDTKDILYLTPGVTVASYDKATRTIVFNINPILVEAKSGISTILFRVKTIKDCESLTDACSNEIKNTAVSKYNGVINPKQVGGDSLSSEEGCNVGTPTATNFLIGLDKCKFEQTLFLCGTVKLKAGGGYKTYVWKDENGTVFGGNNQEVTVTKAGTYTVVTTAAPPCLGIQQKFIVKDYVVNINDNPVNDYADNIDPTTKLPYKCINDGKPFPKIFLCGKTASKFIDTKITGATSIVWQETKDARPGGLDDTCPDVNATNWTEIAVGPTYTVNRAGTFRLVVTYNNTCVNMYYFNATQSVVDPTFIKQDIVCDTKGSITITNPKPNDGYGYEYSLDGKLPYQASNVFDDVAAGRYLVHIRTKAVDNTFEKCVYTADVTISKLTFLANVETTNPLCTGKGGTIKATVNGVSGWYQFTVKDATTGVLKGDSGQIADPTNYHLFEGIAPGTYNVEITSKDGCKEVKKVTIDDYSLSATATITKPLTCEAGEITVVVTGGKPVAGVPPFYYYYVNGATTPLTNPVIPVGTAGNYDIVVVDAGGCSVTIPTITVPDLIRPTATIDKKDVNCYGSATGEISITLNPAVSPYTVSYSVNGVAGPFSTINPIKNLAAGDYDVVVKYTYDSVDCFDESKKITIGEAGSALTASAGIAELSGCGLPGNENQGKVRITNAQGGKPFPAPNLYRYSFDGGKTWITSNEAYIDPSATPYTFYIKDAADCIFPMTGIVLDPKPADPTIEVSTPTFNCNGTASTTVTVTNTGGGNYEYEYLLNGVVNTNNPPNVFVNVPPSDKLPGGYHTISVRYKLVSVPTYSTLLKEDFGSGGTTTTPGIAKAYCFNDQRVNAPYKCGTQSVEDDQYSVTSFFWRNDTAWFQYKDHTTAANPKPDPLGRYLLVNIGSAAGPYGVLYSKPIIDVIKNQPIKVDLFVGNLLNAGVSGAAPIVRFELVDKSGKVVATQDTGKIAEAANDPNRTKWVPIHLELNPGDNDNLTFVIRSGSILYAGNDLVIDDISVYQLPKSCLSTKEFKVIVDPNKKFTAEVVKVTATKCKGSNDGSITIIAKNFNTTNGFKYSTDKGITWKTSYTEETLVTGLSEGVQDIRVSYDDNPASAECKFTFDPNIGSPDKFEVDATTTDAKCSVGATVTATAKGGTPGYTFTLIDSATPPNKVTFPNNGILTDVKPGSYTVSGVDANGCSDNKDTALVILAPVAPKATIKQDTGLCYDATKATITVEITDGKKPYTYQVKYNTGTLSGSFPVTDASFTYEAKATGDYTFVVRDSYGCETTTVSQKINEKLTSQALTTTSLSCKTPPNAEIEVTISGGTSPFTYIVNGDTTKPVSTSGPKFTYTTNTAGTYTFLITDKNSCTTTAIGEVAAITNPDVKAESTNPKCNGESNGSVSLDGSLGSGGYLYSFDSSPFTNKTVYSGLKAGVKYLYQVMDSKGCVSDVKEITLTQPDLINPSASISTAYTCETKATITASATGGNGNYTYILYVTKNSITTKIGTNTTGIFNDLTIAGDYNITITDSKGCTISKFVGTIKDLDPPTAMVIKNSDLTCLSNNVNVTIKPVTGGTGTLEYAITAPAGLIKPYQTNDTFIGLAPGTYTFTVRDENKCTFSMPYTIKSLIPVVVTGEVESNISCLGSADGSAKFTIKDLGNNVDYSYTIDGGTVVTGTTPSAPASTTVVVSKTGLAVGNHTLILTVTATNCSFSKTVEILAPTAELKITPTTVTPLTCNANGKAVVNTTGGWGSNKYTLTLPNGTKVGPQDSNIFEGLTVTGNYTVLVEDLNGCKKTDSFTLAPEVKPTADIDAATNLCYTPAGATIKVTPNTQTNYVYSLNGATPQGDGTFTGLAPGKYIVRVTDTSTGCYIDLAEQIVVTQLTASLNLINGPKCNATDIRIDGEVRGGTPIYKYKVTINGDDTLDPTVYTVGGNTFTYNNAVATAATTPTTYLFTFTDAANCTTTLTEIVKPKTDPKFIATGNSTILCNGVAGGSIAVSIDTSFGVGPYIIDVYNTTTSTPYGTKITGLPAGNYTVKVTDVNGCFSTQLNVKIDEPDPIVIDFKEEDLKCEGGGVSRGRIIINSVTGGTKNYDYYVTGTNNYNEVRPNETGTSVFFEIVDFGLYQIKVIDKNTCQEVISNIMIAAPVNYLNIDIETTATCAGGKAAVSVGSAFASNGPFHFAIYTGPGQVWTGPGALGWKDETVPGSAVGVIPPVPGSKKAVFDNLIPGITYSFIVYDESTKCYYYQTADTPIPSNSSLSLDAVVANNVTCNGAKDGSVTFTITNGYTTSVDVSYQVYESISNLPIIGVAGSATIAGGGNKIVDDLGKGILPVGSYYVLVSETSGPNTGCGVPSKGFNIKESELILSITAKSTKNANCNPKEGIIEAVAKGGTTLSEVLPKPATPGNPAVPGSPAVPYLYKIFPDDGTPAPVAGDFNIATDKESTFKVEAGDYLVYVRDAYGCITFAKVTVDADPIPEITAVAGNQCTAVEGAFTIIVDLKKSGIGKHEYSLDGGEFKPVPAIVPFTISNLSSGTHKVQVRDENICGNTVSNITIYSPLSIDASFTAPPICKNADGTITAVATGGSGAVNYEFTLVNNTTVTTYPTQTTGEFKLKAAGKYTVTVKDKITNCEKSYTFDLLIPTAIDFSLDSTAPFCTTAQGNDANGTVTVTLLNNDNPPYEYTLTMVPAGGTTIVQNTKVFTGLTFGTYNVKVKSDKGCVLDKNITINEPIAVTAILSQDDFKCDANALKDIIVTITPAGGAGNGDITKYKYSKNGTVWVDNNTFNVTDTEAIQTLTYYVKDANDCVFSDQITINPFPKLTTPTVKLSTVLMDCINKEQAIEVTINGGSNTPKQFEYQVYQDGVLIIGSRATVTGNTFTYPAKTAGATYQFEIFDMNTTCSIMSEIQTVPLFNKIVLVANASTQVGCKGDSTGEISINITGYEGKYNYQILVGGVAVTSLKGLGDTAQLNPFVLPHLLKAGTDYTVVVTETEFPFCDVTSDVVIITEPIAELALSNVIKNVNKNCNTAGAVVTVPITSITGGTPDYTYAFVEDGTSPVGKYNNINTATLNPATNTKWDVWVMDSNGCSVKQSIVIAIDPIPFNIKADVISQCFDPITEEYAINVTASGVGPFEYSLDGVNFQANPLIVKSPGTYPVYAKDANGCTGQGTTGFTILDPLGLSAEITTYPTCNGNEGVITLTGLGGTPSSYQYSIGSGSFRKSNVFGGLSSGIHTFWVKDMVTNCTKEITKEIPTAISVTGINLTPTHVSCNTGTDGTITAALTAGNTDQVYTYSLLGVKGLVRVAQESPLFKDLPADKYTITVLSGRGCEGFATIEVTEPTPIVIAKPIITEFTCTDGTNVSNQATIEVNVSGGTPDDNGKYKYEFIKVGTGGLPNEQVQFTDSPKYTEFNPAGGSYIINVYDKNSCPATVNAAIEPFVSIDAIKIDVVNGITCNDGENIKVTVTSKGVLPALEYFITYPGSTTAIPSSPIGSNTFNNLPVGEYTITVKNTDTGCSLSTIHRVDKPNTFDLKATNVKSITCFNEADGSIDFTLVDSKAVPSNLPNGFTYVITGPTSSTGTSSNLGPLTIGNLKAGSYKIEAILIDSPFCTVTTKFTIDGPLTPLELEIQHSEITCAVGNNDGKIIASAKGGWPGGYEFQLELNGAPLVAWSTQSTFPNLGVGNYVVKVRDSKECVVPKPLELKIPEEVKVLATVAKAMLTCNGDNSGELTVTTTGGSGKYLYTLVSTYPDGVVTKNGPQVDPVFTNLKAGSYMVIVSDEWKCTGTSVSVEIKEPTIVKASLGIKTIEGCNRLPVIKLTATGGTGPYKYGTDGINFTSAPFNSSVDITLPQTAVATTYKYYVQDALGCTSYATQVDFSPVPALVFSSVVDYDIHCKGSSTGSIYATAIGGLGNYVYTLLDASKLPVTPAPTQNKPGQFDNLAKGDYFVQVVSDDCKAISLPVSITEPATSITATAVPTDLTCNGSDNGKIVVTAQGGTGILRYAISPDFRQFFESNVFDDLEPGFYDVLIQDENGCEFLIKDIEIKQPDILSLSLVPGSILPEYCDGDKDGAFSIKIVGGTAPYKVVLDDRNGTYEQILGDEHTFIQLVGGTHTVYIIDANNCIAEVEIVTPDAVKLEPTAKVNTDCVNNLAANFVTITIDGSNTNPVDVDYALDGGVYQESNIFVNVAPGMHTVTARHTNGCEQTTLPFTIAVVQPLTLTLADGGLNEIVATATGGGGDYQFTLDGEPYGSVNKFIIYKSGTYTVTVTDKNGCTATASRYFEYIDVCIPNHFTPNGDGINDTWAPGCTVNYKDLTFDIFDRYGRVICKYRLGQKWDGKYNGNELPSGDYWYVLKLNDKKDDREFVGHFTLYR